MAPRAFTRDELVRHAGFVRRLAGRLVADGVRADDVAQETLVRALERPPPRAGNLAAWLRRVASRLAWRQARGEARRRRRERVAARPEAVPVEDAAARLETERRLVDAVLALDEPYRSTVVLRYLDDLGAGEIARRQGIPRKTVETRLARALAQLRGRLEGMREEGGGAWRASLLALLATARESGAAHALRAAGGTAMASKATIGAVGFLCGIGATALYHDLAGSPPPDRASRRTSRESPAEPPSSQAAPVVAARDAAGAEAGRPAAASAAPADYLRRINAARDPQGAFLVACEVTQLTPEEARAVFLAIFRDIAAPAKRAEILRAFVPYHPCVLDLLDLGATDPDAFVRARAFDHLRPFAVRAFQEEPDAYRLWRARTADLPVVEVLRLGAREFVARVEGLTGEALERELRLIGPPFQEGAVSPGSGISIADLLREAGVPALVEPWIVGPMPDEDAEPEAYRRERDLRRAAWMWLERAQPDEAYLRRVVAPVLFRARRGDGEGMAWAARLLSATRQPWAIDLLLEALHEVPLATLDTFGLGQALGQAGDRRAIPHLIGAIAADDTYSTVYGLGYFGLGPLTGIAYDESHDAAWWLRWWDENRAGLPAEAAAQDPRARARGFRR